MFDKPTNNEDDEDKKKTSIETYIPYPFLKHELEPYGWPNILHMLDVCTNEVKPTLFYDKEGYDPFPFEMVNLLSFKEEGSHMLEPKLGPQ